MGLKLYDLINSVKAFASVRPDEYAAGTTEGASVDAQEAYGILWVADVGDAEGTPTSFTVDITIKDSDDDSTFANAKDEANANIAFAQIIAINGIFELQDKLHANAKAGNRPSKRYRRASSVVAFVGGTSPNVAVSVHGLLVRRFLKS
jgi:hypothetical protein